MGANSSGVDLAAFQTLQNDVKKLNNNLSNLTGLSDKVDNISKAAASAIKYDDLALAITTNTNNNDTLAKAIANNPNKLGDALAGSIGNNQTVIQSLQDKLGTNTNFQTAMADTLSSEKYKVKFQGPKGADGNIGDQGALKSNMFDKGNTMWCADGDICYIPDGKNWIRHPGPNLVLGAKQDKNRWIIHSPNDDRKSIFIAPGNGTDNWDWDKQATINSNGVLNAKRIIAREALGVGDLPDGWTNLNLKRRDGRWTNFDWKDDSKNYIRGDTQFDDSIRVNGRLCAGDFCFRQDGDNLYLEKDGWGKVLRFGVGWDNGGNDIAQFYRDPKSPDTQHWWINRNMETGRIWK
jgi:hypothetical protein